MNFPNWLSIVGGSSGIFALVAMAGYWLFQLSVKSRLDISKQREIDHFKHSIQLEMERHKHQLELEQRRLSVVFENQRASFSKVLQAMGLARKAILDAYREEEGVFYGIDRSHADHLADALQPESLLIPSDCDWVLREYVKMMRNTVAIPPEYHPPSREIERVFVSMVFMASRLKECFRKEVGLRVEGDPLKDLHVFLAVRLINSCQFDEAQMPTRTLLRWTRKSPEEMLELGKRNIAVLREELGHLKGFLEKDEGKRSTFYELKIEAERYLDRLKNETSGVDSGVKV